MLEVKKLRRDGDLSETFLRIAQGMHDTAGYGEMDMALNLFQKRLQRFVKTVAEQQLVDVVRGKRTDGVEMALNDTVRFLVDENLTGQNVVGKVCSCFELIS